MRHLPTRGALLLALALAACGKGSQSPAPTPSLLPPETFNFAAQPIAFAPPAAPWAPEGELSGGLRGVRYVKRGSVGEAIGVANYYDVSQRLRAPAIARLADVDPNIESFQFEHALSDAWCRRPDPYTDLEREVCTDVDDALNRAVGARRARDYDGVREALMHAHERAERLHYALADVIDRALFRPETTANAARYAFVGKRDTTIAGERAVVVDYTIDLSEGRRFIRKAYVMHNDHLFVADFIGLESSLPLFDQVVASIGFPP